MLVGFLLQDPITVTFPALFNPRALLAFILHTLTSITLSTPSRSGPATTAHRCVGTPGCGMDKPDRSDAEDDILRYLNFSDPEPLPLPPPPPPPLPNDHHPARLDQTPEPAYDDSPVWGLNYESILQGVQDFDTGEGSSRNTEVIDPVFVQFQPGQLDCTNCCVLRELVHSNGTHVGTLRFIFLERRAEGAVTF